MSGRWRNPCVVAGLAVLVAGCRRGADTPPQPAPTTRIAPAAQPPKPGEVVTNSLGMKLAYVPPGEFVMGSGVDEPGRHDDEARHPVRITRGFHLGVTEVTQGQWKAVSGFNRSEVEGNDLPVSRISWQHAVTFCKQLSRREGRTYRLPTEAEWEYACRAGSTGPFAGTGGADEMAWHMNNSDDVPHPVATKRPNAWGFCDLHGNVAEWCADRYARDYPGAAADPNGPAEGKYRVVRGGSFGHFPRACRSAARASQNPAYQLQQVGLRVVMETPPTENGT